MSGLPNCRKSRPGENIETVRGEMLSAKERAERYRVAMGAALLAIDALLAIAEQLPRSANDVSHVSVPVGALRILQKAAYALAMANPKAAVRARKARSRIEGST